MSPLLQGVIAVSLTFLVLSMIHIGFAILFRRWLIKRANEIDSELLSQQVQPTLSKKTNWSVTKDLPKASVLMAVRGCDTSLERNLDALLNQQYSEYEVIVVVDNPMDPSWEIVRNAQRDHDPENRLRFEALSSPSSTCSLKCSALVQATKLLSSDCQVIVLVDSDIVPHATWLQEVVDPLADAKIGVVTGSQWHCPSNPNPGSLLRSLWNCGAMVASAINANPWAGTCAMRYADVQRSGLIGKWRQTVVDDGPIKSAFADLGLSVHFDPRLIMINRETCSFRSAGQYVTRMLTWSRIFEPTFLGTVFHAIAMSGLYLSWLVALVLCCFSMDFSAISILVGVFVLSSLLHLVAFLIARSGVNRIASQRGSELSVLGARTLLSLCWLLPCCQWLHGVWTLKATVTRETEWREITYRLHPNQRVQMVDYRPYPLENVT